MRSLSLWGIEVGRQTRKGATMIDWLREKAEVYECHLSADGTVWGHAQDISNYEVKKFLAWLEATGASPWRSVEDEMPGDQVSVLVVCEGYIRLSWAYDGEFEVGTTHWMPVPPLPQEQQP